MANIIKAEEGRYYTVDLCKFEDNMNTPYHKLGVMVENLQPVIAWDITNGNVPSNYNSEHSRWSEFAILDTKFNRLQHNGMSELATGEEIMDAIDEITNSKESTEKVYIPYIENGDRVDHDIPPKVRVTRYSSDEYGTSIHTNGACESGTLDNSFCISRDGEWCHHCCSEYTEFETEDGDKGFGFIRCDINGGVNK